MCVMFVYECMCVYMDACVCVRACTCVYDYALTQLVPVGQQDGGAVEHVGEGCLDQFPARDALDSLRQGGREPVQLVLHQHALKGLGNEPSGH